MAPPFGGPEVARITESIFDPTTQYISNGITKMKRCFSVKKRVRIKKSNNINWSFVNFLKENYPSIYDSLGLREAVLSVNLRNGYLKENISGKSSFKYKYLPARHTLEGLYKKLFLYTRPQYLCDDAWSLSLDFLKEHFSSSLYNGKVLSYDETIEFLKNSSSKDSSTGYVWKKAGYKSKNEFWDNFKPIYDEVEASIEKGENPVLFWTMFWKDEMRETSRVLDGNSRAVWSCSPIQLFYSVKYFSHLFKNFLGNREFTWSFCGSDFHSSDFDYRLNAFKNCVCFALDYSPFDASQTAADIGDQFELMYDSLLPIYHTDYHLKRLNLMMSNEIFSHVIMPDGNVIMKESGNPTGSWFTMLRNIWQNFRYLAYVWIKSRLDHGLSTLYQDFIASELAILNGDDSLVKATYDLNPINIRKYLPHLETTSCLTVNGRDYGSVDEMSFCNCRPFFLGKKLVPLHDSSKILLSFCFKIFDDLDKFEEKFGFSLDSQRAIGYLVANPFDTYYCAILEHYCVSKGYSTVNLQKIRNRCLDL